MKKEPISHVDKVWGEEIWFVNADEYCGKLLILDRGATSSYHCHRKKQETFYSIEGYAVLTIEDKEFMLAPFTRAKTIMPGEYHKFHGITEAIIVEVSMHHEETDVVRLTASEPKQQDS